MNVTQHDFIGFHSYSIKCSIFSTFGANAAYVLVNVTSYN